MDQTTYKHPQEKPNNKQRDTTCDESHTTLFHFSISTWSNCRTLTNPLFPTRICSMYVPYPTVAPANNAFSQSLYPQLFGTRPSFPQRVGKSHRISRNVHKIGWSEEGPNKPNYGDPALT